MTRIRGHLGRNPPGRAPAKLPPVSDSLDVAWIGAGIMGRPMAGHLMAAGHRLVVSSRREESARELVDAGARWAATPAEAAREADVVFSMVGYPADVRAVLLGPDGALEGAREGSLLVDMTTSEPSLAVEVAEAAAARGVAALDAPVSGGDVGAREARLVIMVGGEPEAFARARPLLEVMGGTVELLGPAGSGQHTKMTNQVVIASSMVAMCEGLTYAARAGLDVEQVLGVIGGGAAGSWGLANLAPRIVRGDLAPGFKVDHFLKDLGIALDEARRMQLPLPGLALAEQLYRAAQAQGRGQDGTQALIEVLRGLGARG